jgi:phosphatidylglycerol:prolipoprotein diacylglycerol transferase
VLPRIIDIGPVTIHPYGLMLAIGALCGVWVATRTARRVKMPAEMVIDLAMVVLVAGVVGARLAYVLLHVDEYAGDWIGVLRMWDGGLTYFGGLAAGVAAGAVFAAAKRTRFLLLADVAAPGLAIGYGFARIGCLLHGCCYGKPAHFLGIRIHPDGDMQRLIGPVHPTQIYSSLAAFATAAILAWLWRRRRWDGEIFITYALLYGLYRFLIEFLRWSTPDMIGWGGLTWAQWASATVFVCSVIALWVGRKRAALTAPEAIDG